MKAHRQLRRSKSGINLRRMSEHSSQTEPIAHHAANRANEVSAESTRPAGRVLIWYGVLATLIGLALGLVMSSVGS